MVYVCVLFTICVVVSLADAVLTQNMLEVYVFWNFHEPVEGHFNFNGTADLYRCARGEEVAKSRGLSSFSILCIFRNWLAVA